MEQICKVCSKKIITDDKMLFCPYCGQHLHRDTISHIEEKDLSWKIETVFGNQAKYAEKTKEICRQLKEFISAWTDNQISEFWEKKDDCSITAMQLSDAFEFLRSSSDIEEMEFEYRSFIRTLKEIYNGQRMIRSARNHTADISTYVQDNLRIFEGMLGLPVRTEYLFNEIPCSNEMSVYTGTYNLNMLFEATDIAFDSIKQIVKNQGFLCVQNCNYEHGSIRLLKNYTVSDNQEICNYDVQKIINALNDSSSHDFGDMFDEHYNEHIAMFFECLWVLYSAVLDSFSEKTINEGVPICEHMNEWLSYLEISIDRSKDMPFIDMVSIYLNSRKAFMTVKKNFE